MVAAIVAIAAVIVDNLGLSQYYRRMRLNYEIIPCGHYIECYSIILLIRLFVLISLFLKDFAYVYALFSSMGKY